MTKYVSKCSNGNFLILSYHPETDVVECFVATSNVRIACGILTEETGVIHVPSDADQIAWARIIHQRKTHVQTQKEARPGTARAARPERAVVHPVC